MLRRPNRIHNKAVLLIEACIVLCLSHVAGLVLNSDVVRDIQCVENVKVIMHLIVA